MKRYSLLKYLIITTLLGLFLSCPKDLYAGTIYLKNGDRISGKVVRESRDNIAIESEAMGLISINRGFIKRVITDELTQESVVKEKGKLWKKELSVGYNKSSGNTKNSALSMRLYANRKTELDEFTLKADTFYSSTNRKMDAQKWYGSVRYAFSFWGRKWYNFYKFESDHDRFANVDYRLVPSTGIGYWFSDREDWKAMAETGIGFEHTNFRNETKDNNEAILMPRVFFEKELFGASKLSQDTTLYSTFDDFGDYRLHSEAAFTNPISDNLSLRLSLIDDYNSNSAKETKKNDLRFTSSLVYSF